MGPASRADLPGDPAAGEAHQRNGTAPQQHPFAPAASAEQNSADPWWFWFVVSIPWGPIASFLAAVYTAMLACVWMWKKIIRSLLVRWGWLKPPVRRVLTAAEFAEKLERLQADQEPLL